MLVVAGTETSATLPVSPWGGTGRARHDDVCPRIKSLINQDQQLLLIKTKNLNTLSTNPSL